MNIKWKGLQITIVILFTTTTIVSCNSYSSNTNSEKCPCLPNNLCPKIFGSSPDDIKYFGIQKECNEPNDVRCCGVTSSSSINVPLTNTLELTTNLPSMENDITDTTTLIEDIIETTTVLPPKTTSMFQAIQDGIKHLIEEIGVNDSDNNDIADKDMLSSTTIPSSLNDNDDDDDDGDNDDDNDEDDDEIEPRTLPTEENESTTQIINETKIIPSELLINTNSASTKTTNSTTDHRPQMVDNVLMVYPSEIMSDKIKPNNMQLNINEIKMYDNNNNEMAEKVQLIFATNPSTEAAYENDEITTTIFTDTTPNPIKTFSTKISKTMKRKYRPGYRQYHSKNRSSTMPPQSNTPKMNSNNKTIQQQKQNHLSANTKEIMMRHRTNFNHRPRHEDLSETTRVSTVIKATDQEKSNDKNYRQRYRLFNSNNNRLNHLRKSISIQTNNNTTVKPKMKTPTSTTGSSLENQIFTTQIDKDHKLMIEQVRLVLMSSQDMVPTSPTTHRRSSLTTTSTTTTTSPSPQSSTTTQSLSDSDSITESPKTESTLTKRFRGHRRFQSLKLKRLSSLSSTTTTSKTPTTTQSHNVNNRNTSTTRSTNITTLNPRKDNFISRRRRIRPTSSTPSTASTSTTPTTSSTIIEPLIPFVKSDKQTSNFLKRKHNLLYRRNQPNVGGTKNHITSTTDAPITTTIPEMKQTVLTESMLENHQPTSTESTVESVSTTTTSRSIIKSMLTSIFSPIGSLIADFKPSPLWTVENQPIIKDTPLPITNNLKNENYEQPPSHPSLLLFNLPSPSQQFLIPTGIIDQQQNTMTTNRQVRNVLNKSQQIKDYVSIHGEPLPLTQINNKRLSYFTANVENDQNRDGRNV